MRVGPRETQGVRSQARHRSRDWCMGRSPMKEEGIRVPMEAVWQDKELQAGRRPDDRTWSGSGRSELSRREFTAGGGGKASPLAWYPTSTGLPSKAGLLL